MDFANQISGRVRPPGGPRKNLNSISDGPAVRPYLFRTVLHTFFLVSIFFILGCSSSKEDISSTLRIGNGAEPTTLDPHLASTMAEAHILNALFEGLIGPDPENDLGIAPGVARSWTSNDNHTQFTFTLRHNARWSDGSRVTSQDFHDAYERILNPKLGAGNAELLYDLRHAKAYNEGVIKDFSKVGIETPDEHTLILSLERSTPYFLQKLKHWAWRPIHRLSIEANGGFHDLANNWATNAPIISNGPYVIKKWRRNERIELERNASYWDAHSVSIKSLQFYPYENIQTEFRAFQASQLDITEEIPSEQMGQVIENLRQDPILATTYLLLNNESPSLADVSFRKALSQAINRKLLIRAIEKSGSPATSFTPGSIPDYEAADFDTDPIADFDRPASPLRFLVSNRESSIALAEAMQQMWRRELGIDVRIQNMEFKSLLASLDAGDYDISYLAWHGDYLDPITFLEIWRSDSRFNRARWKQPQFDALLDASASTLSTADRFTKLAEAESLLGAEMPIIPLFWKTKDYLISPRVQGWSASLIDLRSYKHVQLTP